MRFDLLFFLNSILFGTGLAMDAFSVSVANSLNEPEMPRKRAYLIAGVFGAFQTLMPLIGWFCVRTIAETFKSFQRFIPWIALILLLYIGGKMLIEGLKADPDETDKGLIHGPALFIQGIATSIDALSVGFTISEYNFEFAFVESLIIGVVTFLICLFGIFLGKKAAAGLAGKAPIIGGVILIAIGLEILIKGIV